MIQDESDGFEDTWRFLDHQVQGVHHVSIRPTPQSIYVPIYGSMYVLCTVLPVDWWHWQGNSGHFPCRTGQCESLVHVL